MYLVALTWEMCCTSHAGSSSRWHRTRTAADFDGYENGGSQLSEAAPQDLSQPVAMSQRCPLPESSSLSSVALVPATPHGFAVVWQAFRCDDGIESQVTTGYAARHARWLVRSIGVQSIRGLHVALCVLLRMLEPDVHARALPISGIRTSESHGNHDQVTHHVKIAYVIPRGNINVNDYYVVLQVRISDEVLEASSAHAVPSHCCSSAKIQVCGILPHFRFFACFRARFALVRLMLAMGYCAEHVYSRNTGHLTRKRPLSKARGVRAAPSCSRRAIF